MLAVARNETDCAGDQFSGLIGPMPREAGEMQKLQKRWDYRCKNCRVIPQARNIRDAMPRGEAALPAAESIRLSPCDICRHSLGS